jgi:hypothetical protein
MGVAGAADVPQQGDPVDRAAEFLVDAERLADPPGQQARPQL